MPHWVSTLEVAQVNKGLHYFGLKIPCSVRLIQPFCNGEKVFIHGLPKPDSEKFIIELRSDLSDGADVCLQISVDCRNNSIVFGTCNNGDWVYEEEKMLENESFLECDKPFLFELTAAADGYDLTVNNNYVANTPYRVSTKASHILISGDLRLPGLHFPTQNMEHTNAITIPGNMQVSSVFNLSGRVLSDPSFSINFQTGESSDSDIIFHFNPRFNMECVVRNNRANGEWGDEEKEGENFPFSKDQEFSMMIVARPGSYHIWIDGKKFAAFNHRAELTKASVLNIEGGVQMYDISIDSPPESMPAGSGFEEQIFKSEWKEDKYNPEMPFNISINEAQEDNIFCMSAVVLASPKRFHINFQTDLSEDSDVVFHYNPRFDARQVILNTRDGGDWSGNEVRWNDFPFREGLRFEIIIVCKESGFLVSVNDESPRLFPLRLNLSRAKFIAIKGDVFVKRAIFM